MADITDLDKDGIPDNIDIDGGNGTGVATTSSTSDAAIAALIAKILGGGSSTPSASSTTTTSKGQTLLTQQSAYDLLNGLKDSVGFTGGLTGAQVTEFMNNFNDEQAKRIRSVVTSVYNKRTPGATSEDLVKQFETTMQTEYPSFFDPKKTATDWLWGKINFGDSKTLAGKNLSTLSSVRNIVSDFQILGYSDAQALLAAKDIAMGKYTLDDFTIKLQQIAIKEYPQFADRFAQDPTMTTKKIAQPILNMLADTWEVDPASIKMNDPIVMQWLHPGGSDGKQPQLSYYDAYQKALNDPKRELTKAANESARSAASELASSFGFGI